MVRGGTVRQADRNSPPTSVRVFGHRTVLDLLQNQHGTRGVACTFVRIFCRFFAHGRVVSAVRVSAVLADSALRGRPLLEDVVRAAEHRGSCAQM
jgi:hypothetical protein